MAADPFELARFVVAQAPLYARVREELAAGCKRSHWMWFIFPQLRGLGSSPMSQRYALSGIGEARAYLGHPLLGPRLRECTQLVLRTQERTAREIFGAPDDLKFRSCMTLFAQAGTEDALFREALDRFFAGEPDALTLRLLEAST